MAKRIATPEDLEKYPELAQAGLKVGEEFEIPDEALNTTDEEGEGDPEDDDGTGGNHPPKPGKP